MDVVASLYERNSLLEFVAKTSRQVFIPLTVCGGLRTLDDIKTVLRAGADKVVLNTAAVRRPELIREASLRFGSSTILVSIEAIRMSEGHYEAYTDNGRERTGVDALEWAVRAAEFGAGEIMVTSIDREGTGKGFDVELTRRIAESVPIPVIACGGAGAVPHICEVITRGKADAVCLGSILHYNFVRHYDNGDDFFDEGNVEYLRTRRGFSRIQDATLPEVKASLLRHGIPCRPVEEGPTNA